MRSNRRWMPDYCQPERFVPTIPGAEEVFRHPPYAFTDFVARALAYLLGDEARQHGFDLEERRVLPCHWKCPDEALFQADLALYGYTGAFPLGKGRPGGFFNDQAVATAVQRGGINLDFGGSHVGYVPGDGGGEVGQIWRPQERAYTPSCSHLTSVIAPFTEVYQDACENIRIYSPGDDVLLVSIPNEYVQPHWSTQRIKLLVDLETLTSEEVAHKASPNLAQPPVARSLFYLSPTFLAGLDDETVRRLTSPSPTPIGALLTPEQFTIFDEQAALRRDGLPVRRLLLYMREIVAATDSPPLLRAAIINTCLEHNHLSDTLRRAAFQPHAFASFTGVFIVLFDKEAGAHRTLFQPLALTLKPAGRVGQVEYNHIDLRKRLDAATPVQPKVDLGSSLGAEDADRLVSLFTFKAG